MVKCPARLFAVVRKLELIERDHGTPQFFEDRHTPNACASAAAAQPCLFTFTQIRSRAAVGLEAGVRLGLPFSCLVFVASPH
jgi:hypothetical protein